jgi:hypothetical protein
VSSLYQLADLADDNGKPVHSKIISTLVMVGTFVLLAINAIDTEAESFVLIALIGAAFGHDWGKAFIKNKYANGNGNGSSTPPLPTPPANGAA